MVADVELNFGSYGLCRPERSYKDNKSRTNFGQHRFCLNQAGMRRCQLRLKEFIDFGQKVPTHILTIRYQYSRDRSIYPAANGIDIALDNSLVCR